MVHCGNAQPWSRAMMALRMWGGKIREARPTSRIRPPALRTTGMMSASQAILRIVAGFTGPLNANRAVPSPVLPALIGPAEAGRGS